MTGLKLVGSNTPSSHQIRTRVTPVPRVSFPGSLVHGVGLLTNASRTWATVRPGASMLTSTRENPCERAFYGPPYLSGSGRSWRSPCAPGCAGVSFWRCDGLTWT